MTSDDTSGTSEFTIIVARRGDQFLMVRHRDRGWELPGGKLEGGEGPVHCALREFREETGHLLGDPKFVMKRDVTHGRAYVFTGHLGSKVQERDPNEAVQDMEWFDALPEELAFPDDPYDAMGEAMGIRFMP